MVKRLLFESTLSPDVEAVCCRLTAHGADVGQVVSHCNLDDPFMKTDRQPN